MNLYPKNDQTITLRGLRDENGALITGAMVTVSLVDNASVVQPGINNIVLNDIVDSPGSYSGAVDEDFNSAPGQYTLQVSAVNGDVNYYAEKPVTVLIRTLGK